MSSKYYVYVRLIDLQLEIHDTIKSFSSIFQMCIIYECPASHFAFAYLQF